MNYDGRIFRAVANSSNGDVDETTRFEYHQVDSVVWATYRGGDIAFGTLLATSDDAGNLNMRYQHLDHAGCFKTGKCLSTPEVMPDGRIRLHERWQWTSGDASEGTSTLEEVDRGVE